MKEKILPTIALRSMTVLPDMVIHFDISRKKSIRAIEKAMEEEQNIFLVTQRQPEVSEPGQKDLFKSGTVARVKQLIKLPDRIVRVQVEGVHKAVLSRLSVSDGMLMSEVEICDKWPGAADELTQKAMVEALDEMIYKYASANPKMSRDILKQWIDIKRVDLKLRHILIDYPMGYLERQRFLEMDDINVIYENTAKMFIEAINVSVIKAELSERLHEAVDKHQKEYILREQLKVLSRELDGDDSESEFDEYEKKLAELNASEEIKAKISKEIKRYKAVSQGSAEANVERGYIETLLSLPWDAQSEDNLDIEDAQRILDRDHYGMKKVKERIIEALAVRNTVKNSEASIICLVGPPGTGKTSIAKSVAEALKRKYVRICLGGVRDEAEIRGHRKTYVGAMPGRIIDGLRQAGVKNPLMLLDEIDKVSNDYRSDTTSALLEVLDGEQNSHFVDHYIELPTDLSQVLFIATANDLSQVSRPLLDRMEIIEVNSYTKNEKLHIAKEHLIRKQLAKNGLTRKQLRFTDKAIASVIDGYTMEAGVRELERMIASVCRKVVRKLYDNGELKPSKQIIVTEKNLSEYLGNIKYRREKIGRKNEVGIVRGLAWTAAGGDTLEIEVNVISGKPDLILTGSMGDVMSESAQIALSYVRSVMKRTSFFDENAFHLHIPEGAVPKDGPSAGVTMAAAIYSAVTGTAVKSDIAMTGELTLRGRVLPVGGLKEKLLAAKTAGVKRVLVPKKNEPDIAEFDSEIVEGLDIVYVSDMKEVLGEALAK